MGKAGNLKKMEVVNLSKGKEPSGNILRWQVRWAGAGKVAGRAWLELGE